MVSRYTAFPLPSALGPLSLGLYQGGWRQPWHGLPRGLGPAETGLQILMVPKSTSSQYLPRFLGAWCLVLTLVFLVWLTNGGTVLQATALNNENKMGKGNECHGGNWTLDNQTPVPVSRLLLPRYLPTIPVCKAQEPRN